VLLLDPAFGEAAVHAHIPLVGGSAGALHRIARRTTPRSRSPARCHHLQGLNDFAQRVVTQDESFHVTRRDAVGADRDLSVAMAVFHDSAP
jgi:hypothetical protein